MQGLRSYFTHIFPDRDHISFYWNQCAAAVTDVFLLLFAFTNFEREYVLHVPDEIQRLSSALYFNATLFYVDFYVFFTVFAAFTFIILFGRGFYLHTFSIILATGAAVLLGYTIGDLFTIKLFIYFSWIITVGIKFPMKISIPVMLLGCTFFAVTQYHPAFFGVLDTVLYVPGPGRSQLFTLIAYMVMAVCFICIYRHAILKWEENYNITQHLNLIMTQMTQFNQKLQDAAKQRGEQAAEQERMRITRDMHDSCGYVFVNIVGLMEAAESSKETEWQKTIGTYETVRSLAARGLQETRRTLHALREIQHPVEKSLEALGEIKKLFESVTGITVELDTGNMLDDYGRTINLILIRTMQEALTNAVRHGRATHISVFLWDDKTVLTMTVKDNGVGSKQVVKGIGLAGMEERLAKVGGTLEIQSPVEGGFCLILRIPLIGQSGEL